MDDHFLHVAEAFTYKSTQYDPFGEGHINLARMRAKVYHQVEQFLSQGDHILEINAGTGTNHTAFLSIAG